MRNSILTLATMRNSILTLATLLFAFSMNGQELRVNETDEFTGVVKRITNSYKVAENITSIYCSVGHIGNDYAFYVHSTLDLGCAGVRTNKIIFLFDDGTSLVLENDIARIDCGDNPSSVFVFHPEDFEGKTVTKIRFKQSRLYDDCEVTGLFTINQLIEAVQ